MRSIFMGSSDFAVESLKAMVEACYEVNEKGFVILLSACQGVYNTILEN